MLAAIVPRWAPVVARVLSKKDRPAGTDNDRLPSVAGEDAVEYRIVRTDRCRPGKAAVAGAEDRPVRPDGIAGQLIASEMDRGELITLRQRILPDPAASRDLAQSRCSVKNKNGNAEKRRRKTLYKEW